MNETEKYQLYCEDQQGSKKREKRTFPIKQVKQIFIFGQVIYYYCYHLQSLIRMFRAMFNLYTNQSVKIQIRGCDNNCYDPLPLLGYLVTFGKKR